MQREHRDKCREHDQLKRATVKLREDLEIYKAQLEERDRLIQVCICCLKVEQIYFTCILKMYDNIYWLLPICQSSAFLVSHWDETCSFVIIFPYKNILFKVDDICSCGMQYCITNQEELNVVLYCKQNVL